MTWETQAAEYSHFTPWVKEKTMDQYGGIQINPVGKNFKDTYQIPDTGLLNTTTLHMQAQYNTQTVEFEGKKTENSNRKNPQELQMQNEMLARANRAYFLD